MRAAIFLSGALCAVVLALSITARADSGGSQGGSCSGDINAACSSVTGGTHLTGVPAATGLSGFVPVANGGFAANPNTAGTLLGIGMAPTNALDVSTAATAIAKAQNTAGTGAAWLQSSTNAGYVVSNSSANSQDSYFVSEVAGTGIWGFGIVSSANNGHAEIRDFANSVNQIDITPGAGTAGIVAVAGSLTVGSVVNVTSKSEHDFGFSIDNSSAAALPAGVILSQTIVTNASTLIATSSYITTAVAGVGAGNSVIRLCSDGAACGGGNIYLTCTFASATAQAVACSPTKTAVTAGTTLTWETATAPVTTWGLINGNAHMTTP